jgi:hypothetical protein
MPRSKIVRKRQKWEEERLIAEEMPYIEQAYENYLKNMAELGADEYFHVSSREEFREREIEKLKTTIVRKPSGLYLDKQKTLAEHQRKFVEFMIELCPNIFDELRELVGVYKKVFGENESMFGVMFDFSRLEIYELDVSLNATIYRVLKPFGVFHCTRKASNFDIGFKWGASRLLFCILNLNSAKFRDTEELSRLEDEIVGLLINHIDFYPDHLLLKDFEETAKEELCNNVCRFIPRQIITSNEFEGFRRECDSNLTKFLNKLQLQPDIPALIELQYKLVKWLAKHNLTKDWLLRYAYFFIAEFCKNPEIDVREIAIPALPIRSLVSEPFSFKFKPWLPGDESREDYEERLREGFEYKLEMHFHSTALQLDLEEKKRITNRIDCDRVKPLVRWTVQGWTIKQIVENDFQLLDTEVGKTYHRSKVKYLKRELPKFREYDLPYRNSA